MSTILKAAVQADIDAATVATPSADLAVLRVTGERLGCNMSNLDTVSLALANTTTGSESNLELAKRAKALVPSTTGGGSSLPPPTTEIGGIAYFINSAPYDTTIGSARYLKGGFIETDTSKFSTALFKMSLNSRFLSAAPSNLVVGQYATVAGIASNGSIVVMATGTIYDSSGIDLTTPRSVISSDGGMTYANERAITGFDTNAYPEGLIFGSGLFVAFGRSGRVSTTPDGLTWTSRSGVNALANLTDMVWNGTVFVGVYAGGLIRTTNFASIAPITTNIPSTARRIAFNTTTPSTLVVAGDVSANGFAISTDNGATWALRNGPSGANGACNFLLFARGLYYVGYASGVYRSSDLVTWELLVAVNLGAAIYDSVADVFVTPVGVVTEEFKGLTYHPVYTGMHDFTAFRMTRHNNNYAIAGTRSISGVPRLSSAVTNATFYAGSPVAIESVSSSPAKGFVRIS